MDTSGHPQERAELTLPREATAHAASATKIHCAKSINDPKDESDHNSLDSAVQDTLETHVDGTLHRELLQGAPAASQKHDAERNRVVSPVADTDTTSRRRPQLSRRHSQGGLRPSAPLETMSPQKRSASWPARRNTYSDHPQRASTRRYDNAIQTTTNINRQRLLYPNRARLESLAVSGPGKPSYRKQNAAKFNCYVVEDVDGCKTYHGTRQEALEVAKRLDKRRRIKDIEDIEAKRFDKTPLMPLAEEVVRLGIVHQQAKTSTADDHEGENSGVVSDSGKMTSWKKKPLLPRKPYRNAPSDSGYSSISATSTVGEVVQRSREGVYTNKTMVITTSDGNAMIVWPDEYDHMHGVDADPVISNLKPVVPAAPEMAVERSDPIPAALEMDGCKSEGNATIPDTRRARIPRSLHMPAPRVAYTRSEASTGVKTVRHLSTKDEVAQDLECVAEVSTDSENEEESRNHAIGSKFSESESERSPKTGSALSKTPDHRSTMHTNASDAKKARLYPESSHPSRSPSVYSPTSSSSDSSSRPSWSQVSDDELVLGDPTALSPPPPHQPRHFRTNRYRKRHTDRGPPSPQTIKEQSGPSAFRGISDRVNKPRKTIRHYSPSLNTKSFLTMALQSSSEMLKEVATALITADESHLMLMALVLDQDTVHTEIRKSIRLAIQRFGGQLRLEASSALEKAIGAALEDSAVSIDTTNLLMRPHKVVQRQNRSESEVSDRSDRHTSDDHSASHRFEVRTLRVNDAPIWREVFARSCAFPAFKADLMNLVHEPYKHRVLCAIGTASSDQTAREVSWTPPHLLSFSFEETLRVSDRLKGHIEDTMEEVWNWWPLEPRRPMLKDRFCRLKWQSVWLILTPNDTIIADIEKPCGRPQHIDIPINAALALQSAIKTAPAFLRTQCLNYTPVQGADGSTLSAHTMRSAEPFARQTSATSSQPPFASPSASQSTRSPSSKSVSNLNIASSSQQTCEKVLNVYLCTEAGSRQFTEIDCKKIENDVEFFDKIKCEYGKARGWPRLWFSTWRYDHCEFRQFQITGINLAARLNIAIPKPSDQLYQYDPRPAREVPPDGPISQDEFREHYYYKVCPPLWSWERWHHRRIGLSTVNKEAVEAVPKRVVKLNLENGGREYFYGLHATEARSALRVAIYAALCNLPGLIFFFLWLYHWKHGLDLQGAAIPVQLSLSLTVSFGSVLYWTR